MPYDGLKPKYQVVFSLETGKVIEGKLKLGSDTGMRPVLDRVFPMMAASFPRTVSGQIATYWPDARVVIGCRVGLAPQEVQAAS